MILLVRHLRCFRLRLSHPGENFVIAANVLHIMHRLATPRVAVAGLAVPLFLRQQRQVILHIDPAVGVAAVVTGQNARIIQMPDANVIRRQGKPGAVRLGNVGRQLIPHPHQIPRAPGNALRRIDPVGHADELGRRQGQHHQATYAGRRARIHIPQ